MMDFETIARAGETLLAQPVGEPRFVTKIETIGEGAFRVWDDRNETERAAIFWYMGERVEIGYPFDHTLQCWGLTLYADDTDILGVKTIAGELPRGWIERTAIEWVRFGR